ncbi:aminopeptidase [Candidatus Lokiarchaeum ossiferum]|uniref:aminopeptidase n=1 Tax=Candidatus Lokiarchaeum ossiferum TaxID=2951803 RepID=UPI00352E467F
MQTELNTSDFNEKVSQLAIRYAVNVKHGDKVLIEGDIVASELMRELAIECYKSGAHPLVIPYYHGAFVDKYRYGNDEQIRFLSPVRETIFKTYDVMINIFADHNRQKMALIDPEKMKLAQNSPKRKELQKIFSERVANGKLRWAIVPYPCDSYAQDAKMDTRAYKSFVYSALKLDEEDPAEYWKMTEEKQDEIIEYLNSVQEIHVLGEDTDLHLSVNGRKWENCCGHRNLPDGEVYTSPVETSINGFIRFTYPGIYQGKEIKNIRLDFKDGRVIKGTAEEGQELLDSILSIEGADLIGEFAVGTNYGISKFTKNMLFDEKMGGTMHMALGMGFAKTGSTNTNCTIHWDILKDMKSSESKIIADGTVIYEAGQWQI